MISSLRDLCSLISLPLIHNQWKKSPSSNPRDITRFNFVGRHGISSSLASQQYQKGKILPKACDHHSTRCFQRRKEKNVMPPRRGQSLPGPFLILTILPMIEPMIPIASSSMSGLKDNHRPRVRSKRSSSENNECLRWGKPTPGTSSHRSSNAKAPSAVSQSHSCPNNSISSNSNSNSNNLHSQQTTSPQSPA